MNNRRGGWVRVTRQDRCPVCDHSDWCSISADRAVCHCMRIESRRAVASGGWIHRLDDDQPGRPVCPSHPPKTSDPDELDRHWGPLAQRFADEGRAEVRRLADKLDVKHIALRLIGAGWGALDGGKPSWTFPEKDWAGRIVGIARRFEDGRKGFFRGGRRGLIYPDLDDCDPAPVYVVEGPSDVAACLMMGLRAVGRPSNVGGFDDLALLLGWARSIVTVLGERDHREHDALPELVRRRHRPNCRGCAACWPGWYGAWQLASRLSLAWCTLVDWRLPPKPLKDVRAYLRAGGAGEQFAACLTTR